MVEPPGPRLSDADVRARVARLDALLEGLEQSAGPVAELATEAVEMLTQVYGAALQRVMEQVCTTPALVASLTADELIGHLLVLHGLHPQPVEETRPSVRSHGGDLEPAGIEGASRASVSDREVLRGADEAGWDGSGSKADALADPGDEDRDAVTGAGLLWSRPACRRQATPARAATPSPPGASGPGSSAAPG